MMRDGTSLPFLCGVLGGGVVGSALTNAAHQYAGSQGGSCVMWGLFGVLQVGFLYFCYREIRG